MPSSPAAFVLFAGFALAGCTGPSLINEPRPLQLSKPLAEGRDERIVASIDAVILRNGAGAWTSDADWDEYLVRVRSLSDEPVELREIAIYDELDHRIVSRSNRSDLVDGTREFGLRHGEWAKLARSDEASDRGWAFLAASLLAIGIGRSGAAGMATAVGAGFAGAGAARLLMNAKENAEIQRRGTLLPMALPRASGARIDVFFPMTPRSGRAQVVYVDASGEHRLDIDTRQALLELDSDVPPTLVSRTAPVFPVQARREGIQRGHVVAHLSLDRKGRVQDVRVIHSVPHSIALEEETRRTLRSWAYSEGQGGRTVEVRLAFQR